MKEYIRIEKNWTNVGYRDWVTKLELFKISMDWNVLVRTESDGYL